MTEYIRLLGGRILGSNVPKGTSGKCQDPGICVQGAGLGNSVWGMGNPRQDPPSCVLKRTAIETQQQLLKGRIARLNRGPNTTSFDRFSFKDVPPFSKFYSAAVLYATVNPFSSILYQKGVFCFSLHPLKTIFKF
jgi:hypothetical protein